MEPFLLEVNHSPSFHTPSEVDAFVELPLLRDTLSLLNIQPRHRREFTRRSSERVQCRLYGDTFDSSYRTKAVNEDADCDNNSDINAENQQQKQQFNFQTNTQASSKGQRMSCHAYFASLTPELAWSNHLQAEERNLGGFDLVYPTNVYESQPTTGFQSLYYHLLHVLQ